MLKIAVDIDNTLYATDKCTEDVYESVRREFGSSLDADIMAKCSLRAETLLQRTETWFNPAYLIPDAVAALKRLGTEAELYICTARATRRVWYNQLFQDSGLTFKDIIQGNDYPDKARACFKTGIDILIDDDLINLLAHYHMLDCDPDYKTHFILYTGHTTKDTELNHEYYRSAHANTVSVMSSWGDFDELIKTLP